MQLFPCLYLQGDVELTTEREQHIAERHPDLLPEHRQQISDTLAAPDEVRLSRRFAEARLFTRWFESVRGGKFVVVVVVSEAGPSRRHWIITAYLTGKLSEGDVEWNRV